MKPINEMKKFCSYLVLFVTILSTGVLLSCSNADEPQSDPINEPDNVTYEVKLSLGGEYTNVSESPLSRADNASPKKYYGINVYCMKTDGSETSYNHYAYGVFDNQLDMKISLLGGYKYKFECTSVEDDLDIMYLSSAGTDYEAISYPFYLYGSFYIKDINSFSISQSNYLYYIRRGYSTVRNIYGEGISTDYPRLNRYYGEMEDFIPGNGATAVIPMKRTVFGINVVVNGVPDGCLSWQDKSMNLTFNTNGCEGPEKMEFPHIFTFSDVYDCWKSEETYSQNFIIDFIWTRGNGYQQYFTENITVKRNVMTTITVNLKGGANDVSIGIAEEDVPMDIEDINIDFDGGDLNDTQVEPQE